MTVRGWSARDVGDLAGRFVVVTGSNSGIGLEAARQFAVHGAAVVLACRDVARGERARTLIQRSVRGPGDVRVKQLDVSDLDSVRAFVDGLGWERVDLLVNNAGVMGGAPVSSAQGFDRQVATNHLGPFALTAGLWPVLEKADAGRVVTVSSLAARGGSLSGSFGTSALTDFTPYREMDVYAITKQANLLFTVELARRSAEAGSPVTATAAHPGLARTNLFIRQLGDQGRGWLVPFARPIFGLAMQSSAAGALPTLRAATDRSVPSGGFVGPRLLGGTRGAPEGIPLYPSADQPDAAAALWRASEELTGITFAISGSTSGA
jgi:NAD(P)-dependent dehydrogenase (short-subunit alcohol dehydrogenase family)